VDIAQQIVAIYPQLQSVNPNEHSTVKTAHIYMRIIVHKCRTQYSTEQF